MASLATPGSNSGKNGDFELIFRSGKNDHLRAQTFCIWWNALSAATIRIGTAKVEEEKNSPLALDRMQFEQLRNHEGRDKHFLMNIIVHVLLGPRFQLTALRCNNTTTFNLQRPRPSLLLQVNDHHRIMRTFIFPILVLGHFSVVLMKPIPVALTGMAKEEGSTPSSTTSLPTGDEANAIRGKDSSLLASTFSSPHTPKIEADVNGLESGSSSSTFGPKGSKSNVSDWSKLGRRASANSPVPKDSVEANSDPLSGNPWTGSTINRETSETFRHPEGSWRNSVSSTTSNFGSETSTLSGSTINAAPESEGATQENSSSSKSLIPNSSSKSAETDKIIVEVMFESLWRGEKLDPPEMPYTNPQANVDENLDDALSAVAVDILDLNSPNELKKRVVGGNQEYRPVQGTPINRKLQMVKPDNRYHIYDDIIRTKSV
ncbi:hypothetical protein F5878DRAFT_646786 [Lentinula raphanica]|uniref:Uncharacterized protein n=1 Tax=Lentinula raphanica TaxID=153919 RepID=A0AA38NXH1_9AGAR|nr:hypothetical protein F5878DRAFT_646786 [Lentinula raphanica]